MVDSATIKERVRQLGADLAGVAPVSRFAQAPAGFHPCDIYPGCQSVLVLALRFPLSTLEAKTNSPYTLVRNGLVDRMDAMTTRLADELEAQGIVAIPIPSSEPYDYWDTERRHGRGILSLKHAAVLAGLGAMGKNTLLINERYGNMVWLGALLLSVELEPDPLATYNACRDRCRICLDACPQHALDGTTIDQKLCREHCSAYSEGGGGVYACNTCRKVCPRHAGIKGA
jgi:epoxyqueuosine reductase